MTDGFRISKDLTLPRDLAKKVISIVGKRDSGKTYNGGDLAEELVKAGIPIVVVDSMGIWWGLKVGVKYVDGKQVPDPDKPGLKVVVFGGDHADIPLPMMRGQRIPLVPDPNKIQLMATSIVESGISAVIDTSALPSKTQEMAVITEFIPALQRANRDYGVRTIFLEEAEVVAPQQPMRDEVLCLHVMNNLVKRGGNWNLGCVLMTQRAASINKNILTQSDVLMIGRLNAPQDKAAIQEWVKKAGATDESRKQLEKWYDSLNELGRGEMWVWKPDPPKIRVKTKFRLRETLHATREFLESPDVRNVKPVDVEEYKAKFLKLFEPPKPKVVALAPAPAAPQVVVQRFPFKEAVTLRSGDSMSFEKGVDQPTVHRSTGESFPVPMSVPSVNLPTSQGVTYGLPEPEPRSTLGRLLLVLYKNTDRAGNRKWSLSGMLQILTDNGWPTEEQDLKQTIQYLLQVQMLEPVQAGNRGVDYRFIGRDRIQIIPQQLRVELP